MRKISFVISIMLVSLFVGGYYAYARIDNPTDFGNISSDVSFGSGVSVTQTATAVAVSTSTTAIDIGTSNKFLVALATSTTLVFTDPAGSANLTFKLIQDGPGSRTITWPATVKWPGGSAPTLTTTGNAIDFVACYFDLTLYFCTFSLDLK